MTILLILGWLTSADGAIFKVTKSTDPTQAQCDAGASACNGTLRWAIMQANRNPNSTIVFDIPGSGLKEILLTSPLPVVTARTFINGTTQPGYSNSPIVWIVARNYPDEYALRIGSRDKPLLNMADVSEVRGLGFKVYGNDGIQVFFSKSVTLDKNHVTSRNYSKHASIRVNESSVEISANTLNGNNSGNGIIAQNSTVTISSNSINDLNVGIYSILSTTVVKSSIIGISTVSSSPTSTGIKLVVKKNNLFQITNGNYIFGHLIGIDAISTEETALENLIRGNFFGTTAAGVQKFNRTGIKLVGVSRCKIGGTEAGAPNHFDGYKGIDISKQSASASSPSASRNRISANDYYSVMPNTQWPITLNAGTLNGNIGKTLPAFAATYSGAGVLFSGTSVPNDRVEIYLLSASLSQATYLTSVTTNAAGTWTYSRPLSTSEPQGTYYGATATDDKGNTSEFKYAPSACARTVTPQITVQQCAGLITSFQLSGTGAQINDRFVLQIAPPASTTFTTILDQLYSGTPLSLTHTFPSYGQYSARLKVTTPPGTACFFVKQQTLNVGPASISDITTSQTCMGNVSFQTASAETGTYSWELRKGTNPGIMQSLSGSGSVPSFSVTIEEPGQYKVSLALLQTASGCPYSRTKLFSFLPIPPIDLLNSQPTSCNNSSDGSLTFSPANGVFKLIRVSDGATTTQIDNPTFAGLTSGEYGVTREFNGCKSRELRVVLDFTMPILSICAGYVPCTGTGVSLQINATRTQPSASGAYDFSVMEIGGPVVATGSGVFGTVKNVSMPGAASGKTYVVTLPVMTGADPTKNHCLVSSTIELASPIISLSLDDPDGIYPPCQANNQRTSVVLSASVNTNSCGVGYTGSYTIQLKKKNAAGLFVNDGASITANSMPHTFANAQAGAYIAEVSSSPLSCKAEIPFTIEPAQSFTANVVSSNPTCAGATNGWARADVQGGIGRVHYRWYLSTTPTQTISLLSHVSGLGPGSYTVDISDDNPCPQTLRPLLVTIVDPLTLSQPAINISNCDITMTATDPSNGGPYTARWYKTVKRKIQDSAQPPPNEVETLVTSEVFVQTGLSGTTGTVTSYLNAWVPVEEIEEGKYQVVVENSAGCKVTSNQVDYKIQPFARTYEVRIRWKTQNLNPPKTADPIPVRNEFRYVSNQIQQDIQNQVAACLNNRISETVQTYTNLCFTTEMLRDTLFLNYNAHEENQTLFYYDIPGNLVRSAPPAGIAYTANDRIPSALRHSLVSTYDFDSQGKAVFQKTPDGGETRYIYNDQGQLRFSQSARQRSVIENPANTTRYSYTKYDQLGRVTATGESFLNNVDFQAALNTESVLRDQPDFPNSNTREEISIHYSAPATSLTGLRTQRFIRNRIGYSTMHNRNGDLVSSYYSYDPHGNVEWVGQEVPGLPIKFLDYKYDLISGNVLQLDFNKGKPDQFYHRYSFDEENRLASVETSVDRELWDRDAQYTYFDYGPLKKLSLGHDKIQDVNHTYTIQGLLKAINNPDLSGSRDPATAPDVFGMTLGYFPGDFKRVDNSGTPSQFNSSSATSLFGSPLYNGNISSWTMKIRGANTNDPYDSELTGNTYTYDKLNRLRSSTFHLFNSATPGYTSLPDFASSYTYDRNGNILNLQRSGHLAKRYPMDDLTYSYYNSSNKLKRVQDAIITDGYATDISPGQGTDNYVYDASGNLIADNQEGLRFVWNALGKISEVIPNVFPTAQKPLIRFSYDPSGNRVKKEVNKAPFDRAGQPQRLPESITTTLYIRDATGNINAIYEKTFETITYVPSGTLFLTSRRSYSPPAADYQPAESLYSSTLHFTFPERIEVSEGNASNNVAWLEYRTGDQTKYIYYRGGASTAHPSTGTDLDAGRYYYHFTDLSVITPATGHSPTMADIISAPGDHLTADFLKFHLTGDDHQPNGAGGVGNLTVATCPITELLPDSQWKATIKVKEQPIYGSERIGQYSPNRDLLTYASEAALVDLVPQTPVSPNTVESTMQHWLTAFQGNRNVNLAGTNHIRTVHLKDAMEQTPRMAAKASFHGRIGNSVAVRENKSGQVQLFSVTVEEYWGTPNVMLVYNHFGYLVPWSNGIVSNPAGKPVTASLVSGEYPLGSFVFTTGVDRRIYMHIADHRGNSPHDAAVMVYKNVLVDPSPGGDHYGTALAIIEDRANERIVLFATRHVTGQTELVAFFITPTDLTPTPQVLATISSADLAVNGEMQLSPDGRRVSFVTFGDRLGWFDQHVATLHVFEFSEDFTTAVEVTATPLENGADPWHTSFDFADANRLLISQASLVSHDTNVEFDAFHNTKEVIYTGTAGSLRRHDAGVMQQMASGSPVKVETYNTVNTPAWRDDTFTYTASLWGSGALPLQTVRRLDADAGTQVFARRVGNKVYELKDHLKDVMVTVNDVREPMDGSAKVVSYSNYYPFGMEMPDRGKVSIGYRYGFNGMEKDDDIKQDGNSYSSDFRLYDPRIARWLSTDPEYHRFRSETPYSGFFNNPIRLNDQKGTEPKVQNEALEADVEKVKEQYPVIASEALAVWVDHRASGARYQIKEGSSLPYPEVELYVPGLPEEKAPWYAEVASKFLEFGIQKISKDKVPTGLSDLVIKTAEKLSGRELPVISMLVEAGPLLSMMVGEQMLRDEGKGRPGAVARGLGFLPASRAAEIKLTKALADQIATDLQKSYGGMYNVARIQMYLLQQVKEGRKYTAQRDEEIQRAHQKHGVTRHAKIESND